MKRTLVLLFSLIVCIGCTKEEVKPDAGISITIKSKNGYDVRDNSYIDLYSSETLDSTKHKYSLKYGDYGTIDLVDETGKFILADESITAKNTSSTGFYFKKPGKYTILIQNVYSGIIGGTYSGEGTFYVELKNGEILDYTARLQKDRLLSIF